MLGHPQTVTVLDSQRFGIKAQLTVGNDKVLVVPKEIVKQPKMVEPDKKAPITSAQRADYGRIGAANSPWSKFKKVTGPQQVV